MLPPPDPLTYKDEALREWRTRQDPRCTCRPLYNTSSETVEVSSSGTYGCPLHCTHPGVYMDGPWWRCGCGASSSDPYLD